MSSVFDKNILSQSIVFFTEAFFVRYLKCNGLLITGTAKEQLMVFIR